MIPPQWLERQSCYQRVIADLWWREYHEVFQQERGTHLRWAVRGRLQFDHESSTRKFSEMLTREISLVHQPSSFVNNLVYMNYMCSSGSLTKHSPRDRKLPCKYYYLMAVKMIRIWRHLRTTAHCDRYLPRGLIANNGLFTVELDPLRPADRPASICTLAGFFYTREARIKPSDWWTNIHACLLSWPLEELESFGS